MDVSVHSLDEYLSKIIKVQKANQEKYCQTQIFFRGQSQVGEPEWSITPSVFRSGRKKQENTIYSFAMTECPQDFVNCNNHCEILSTMQHYGIPTRLVDITKNALVALYFSVVNEKGAVLDTEDGVVFVIGAPRTHIKEYDSDVISILASLPRFTQEEQHRIQRKALRLMADGETGIKKFNLESNDVRRLHHEIKKEKPQFEPIINPNDVLDDFIFTPQKTNPRIIRQQGAFIIFGLGHEGNYLDESLPEMKNSRYYDKSFFEHTPVILDKIKIDKKYKKIILEELRVCGVTQVSLFPELYKLGEYIDTFISFL